MKLFFPNLLQKAFKFLCVTMITPLLLTSCGKGKSIQAIPVEDVEDTYFLDEIADSYSYVLLDDSSLVALGHRPPHPAIRSAESSPVSLHNPRERTNIKKRMSSCLSYSRPRKLLLRITGLNQSSLLVCKG